MSQTTNDFYTHYPSADAPADQSTQPITTMLQPTGPLPQYPNDAAARAAGLPDWAFYLNSGGVQQLQGT